MYKMKKLSLYVFLILLFCGNLIADFKNRDVKLNQLFEQLKKLIKDNAI